MLFLAHGVGVNGGGFHGSMPHPLGHHVERYALVQGVNGVSVSEPFGCSVDTLSDVRRAHYRFDLHPCGISGVRPEAGVHLSGAVTPDRVLKTVRGMQQIEHGSGDGDSPVHPLAPFLERLQHDQIAAVIEGGGGQREGFGQSAAGVIQDMAERPHIARRVRRCVEKGRSLGFGQIKPLALGVEEGVGVHERALPVFEHY